MSTLLYIKETLTYSQGDGTILALLPRLAQMFGRISSRDCLGSTMTAV